MPVGTRSIHPDRIRSDSIRGPPRSAPYRVIPVDHHDGPGVARTELPGTGTIVMINGKTRTPSSGACSAHAARAIVGQGLTGPAPRSHRLSLDLSFQTLAVRVGTETIESRADRAEAPLNRRLKAARTAARPGVPSKHCSPSYHEHAEERASARPLTPPRGGTRPIGSHTRCSTS